MPGTPSESEYWNERVLKTKDLDDMIFVDRRRKELWRRVAKTLGTWQGLKALDVCCGFGKFSVHFDQYTGIDFSEEMIKLANKKFPGRDFRVQSAHDLPNESYDVIFEVNSLRSLNWTAEQFNEHFKDHATVAVACLEADQFTIFQKYP